MTRKEKWMSAPPEETVCYCLGVSKGKIVEAIRSGCNSLKAIKDSTKACTGNECETKNPGRKCCSQDILELIGLYVDKADDPAVADSQCCCKSKK